MDLAAFSPILIRQWVVDGFLVGSTTAVSVEVNLIQIQTDFTVFYIATVESQTQFEQTYVNYLPAPLHFV